MSSFTAYIDVLYFTQQSDLIHKINKFFMEVLDISSRKLCNQSYAKTRVIKNGALQKKRETTMEKKEDYLFLTRKSEPPLLEMCDKNICQISISKTLVCTPQRVSARRHVEGGLTEGRIGVGEVSNHKMSCSDARN